MNTELSKTYDPSSVEAEAYRVWLAEGCFHADPAAAGDPYSIVIPPPNVTGALHLGHAINNTLQDILTRNHRMRGFNTLWIPGIDHAGIATQAVVEKQLKEKENKTRHDVGREGLVERIWKWKEQYGDRIIEQLKRLGCSCDWDRTRFTLDEMCARAVRETFFKLFKDGLIYRGKRLVNWDTFLQTSISDDEIYHETVKTNMWHIRYPIAGGTGGPRVNPAQSEAEHGRAAARLSSPKSHATGERPSYMVVATTRPETMLGDTAVAVHPDDPRWNWAIGKSVELPLTDRLIPIIGDAILVDMEFGSGVVKVTPAHDPNDYAVWQRQGGAIDLINILTPDGRINDDARIPAPYRGMRRDAARKKVVEDLTREGLLEKEEPYETEVGHSDRSKTPIEPYLSDQWFVKMAPLAEPALEVVREGKIKFYPERHAQQYLSWLGEKRDWPISRQLWWGHRIPVWHNPAPTPDAIGWLRLNTDAVHVTESETGAVACLRMNDELIERRLEIFGFAQDPDVLDTWFSSALWPHSTLGWPEETPELAKYYPTSVLLTGRDIITLWVARMVMMGLYNMGAGTTTSSGTGASPVRASGRTGGAPVPQGNLGIPFYDVAINPTILDGKGERMSKSKGNGVDPVEIIDGYGADALRFTLTTMATETQDARMPVKTDASGRNTSEKFDLGRNFCNKLWNAARFALSNLESVKPEPVDEAKWSLADRWIVSRFNRAVEESNSALATYRFDQYAKACYDFFWRDLCDWYLEAIKPAMKEPSRAAQTANVLAAMLDGTLRLLHPMVPFITETIWWRLDEVRPRRGLPGRVECPPSRRLVRAAWPAPAAVDDGAEQVFTTLQSLISAVRNLRNEYNVDVKRPVIVSIAAPQSQAELILQNRELIELLASCVLQEVRPDLPPPANSARATAAGCEIFAEGLVDPKAEKLRADKEREKLKRQIDAMEGRLANASYIAKAPPELVQQTRDQLAEARAQLEKLGGQ